jgi:isopenicillin N synthase-like dioxygenase
MPTKTGIGLEATDSVPAASTDSAAPVIRRRKPRSLRNKTGLIQYARDVTSQNGEDGIIDRLFSILPAYPDVMCTEPDNATEVKDNSNAVNVRYCVDVGAWDGQHLSNTYFLLVPKQTTIGERVDEPETSNNTLDNGKQLSTANESVSAVRSPTHWKGLLIEADPCKFTLLHALHAPLGNHTVQAFVSCQTGSPYSLPCLLHEHGARVNLPLDFDFLCIDIDGLDYWVLYDLLTYQPPSSPPVNIEVPVRKQNDTSLTVKPPDVDRQSGNHTDHSTQSVQSTHGRYRPKVMCIEFNPTMPNDLVYIPGRDDSIRHGASLAALVELAELHEYILVETTLFNAFFVDAPYYKAYLQDLITDTSIEALHEETMGTAMYQLFDGSLRLWGCKRFLWHRMPMDEDKLQLLSPPVQSFPFAPESDTTEPFRQFNYDSVVDLRSFFHPNVDANCSGQERSVNNTVKPRTNIDDDDDVNDNDAGVKCGSDMLIEQSASVQKLLDQLRMDGFAYVSGTALSSQLAQSALCVTQEFLTVAPEDLRLACRSKQDRARRGYAPLQTENFASLIGEVAPNDHVRKFRIGPSLPLQPPAPTDDNEGDALWSARISALQDNALSAPNPLWQPNVWPQEDDWGHAETFRDTLERYYSAICPIAVNIVQVICKGLVESHPELATSLAPLLSNAQSTRSSLSSPTAETWQDDLQPLHKSALDHSSILTLLAYSPRKKPTNQQSRKKNKTKASKRVEYPLVAPHTDVGIITVLLFDGGSCAQLQRSDGNGGWVDVNLPQPVPEDPVLVINIADGLSDLSQGRLPSTLHRVVSTEPDGRGGKGSSPRHGCALFVGLHPDQILRINGEEITYEEWRKRRIAKAQSVLRSQH